VCGGLLASVVAGWVLNDFYRGWSSVGDLTEDEVRDGALRAYWEVRGIEPGSQVWIVESHFGGDGCGGVVRIRQELDGQVDEATVVVREDSGAPVGARLVEGSVAQEAATMRANDPACS
jgi:hypothetical protein